MGAESKDVRSGTKKVKCTAFESDGDIYLSSCELVSGIRASGHAHIYIPEPCCISIYIAYCSIDSFLYVIMHM